MRVLVGGATGYLGRHVVRELGLRGHSVRALAPDRDKLEQLSESTDDIVAANVCEPGQLEGCCVGVDAVISTIGLMRASTRTSFHDVDYLGNRNLLREALDAGVRRFIYTSVLQRPGMDKLAIVKAKLAFEHELEQAGIGHTILRPNGYFSDMDQFLNMARKGRVWVFNNGQFKVNPIDGADVALAAVDAVHDGPTLVELGGPEVLTHEDIAQAAFSALDTPSRITSIPAFVAHGLATAMHHLTPSRIHGAPEFVLTVVSRDLIAPTTGTTTLSEHFRSKARRCPP